MKTFSRSLSQDGDSWCIGMDSSWIRLIRQNPLFFVAMVLFWLAVSAASSHADAPDASSNRDASRSNLASDQIQQSGLAAKAAANPSPDAPGLPGASFTTGSNDLTALDDKRELIAGDSLSFNILEDHEAPKQLVVKDSGEVDVPYLGRVLARGMTCKRLAAELKEQLEAKYYYHATVILSLDAMSKALGKVYASGALRTPGRLEIPGNEVFTCSKAVLCAGGFTDAADKHNVRVTRRGEPAGKSQQITVDVGEVLEKGRADLDLPLEPGDMIFVPERLIIF